MTTGWGAPQRMRPLSACLCAVDGMTLMHNLVRVENMLCSLSGSAVRSHPFSIWSRHSQAQLSWEAGSEFFSFYLCSSLPLPPPFCKWVIARLLSFYPKSLVPSALPALLALFCGCSGWAGWEAPDWLQAVPLPGLTSRHCFCPLNRINKSMCQVDCSQETMTQFWHHCPPPPPLSLSSPFCLTAAFN